MADALSRLPSSATPLLSSISPSSVVDFNVLAENQTTCTSIQDLSASSALNLKRVSMNGVEVPRPLVPQFSRRGIFYFSHNIAHPRVRATRRLISSCFVWRGLAKDVETWTRSCLDCQKGKISRHTKTQVLPTPVPAIRFSHIHEDLVGPLSCSLDYTHLFTIIDRTTR